MPIAYSVLPEGLVIDRELEIARVRIAADAGVDPEFRDFNAFYWDFNLLYELDLLTQLDPEFGSRRFGSPWILARGGRAIPSDLRMRIERSYFGSPIDFTVWIPLSPIVTGALLVLAKSIEKIYLIPAAHRLLEAQARRENADARLTEAKALEHEVRNAARLAALDRHRLGSAQARAPDKHGFRPIENVERRLANGPVRIMEFEVDLGGPDRSP